jgi:hypothetical protein
MLHYVFELSQNASPPKRKVIASYSFRSSLRGTVIASHSYRSKVTKLSFL